MFRTDRGTVVAACLMSALGCLMACALLGFPATGGVRFAWVLLWATASVAGMRFLRVQDRRAKACFGTFGALFVLALALGYRLDTAGQTGIEGLLLSLARRCAWAPPPAGPPCGWTSTWPPSSRSKARPPRPRPKARPPRPRPKAPPPNPRPKAPTPNPRPKTPQPPRPASPGTPCWPPWS